MNIEPIRLTRRQGLESFLARQLPHGLASLEGVVTQLNKRLTAMCVSAPAYTRTVVCALPLKYEADWTDVRQHYKQQNARDWEADIKAALSVWLTEMYALPGEPDIRFMVTRITPDETTIEVTADFLSAARPA